MATKLLEHKHLISCLELVCFFFFLAKEHHEKITETLRAAWTKNMWEMLIKHNNPYSDFTIYSNSILCNYALYPWSGASYSII